MATSRSDKSPTLNSRWRYNHSFTLVPTRGSNRDIRVSSAHLYTMPFTFACVLFIFQCMEGKTAVSSMIKYINKCHSSILLYVKTEIRNPVKLGTKS